jgi:hypothetical protein
VDPSFLSFNTFSLFFIHEVSVAPIQVTRDINPRNTLVHRERPFSSYFLVVQVFSSVVSNTRCCIKGFEYPKEDHEMIAFIKLEQNMSYYSLCLRYEEASEHCTMGNLIFYTL